jgi:hypothetical protein
MQHQRAPGRENIRLMAKATCRWYECPLAHARSDLGAQQQWLMLVWAVVRAHLLCNMSVVAVSISTLLRSHAAPDSCIAAHPSTAHR